MISPQQIKFFKEKKDYLQSKFRYLDEEEDEEEIGQVGHDLLKLSYQERDAYKDDLVQPGDNRYEGLYKEEWLKLEKEKERKYVRAQQIKTEQEQFYKKHKLEGDVVKAIELENELRYGN